MSDNLREWCREVGGDLKEQGNRVKCEVSQTPQEGDMEMYSGDYTSGNSTAMNIGAGIAVLFGFLFSLVTKWWALSAAYTGVAGEYSMEILKVLSLPVIGAFITDVPSWVVFVSAFSWAGLLLGIGLFVSLVFDRFNGFTVVLSYGYGVFAVVHVLGSAIFGAMLSLIAVGGFSQLTFAKLYIISRLSVFGIVPAVWAPEVFDFSQVLWLGIVVWWMISLYSLSGD